MRSTLLMLLALLVAPLMPLPAHATVLRVGTGAGCTHADLDSAVQAAHDGDGIFVNVGTYAVANLHFNGKSLTFRGGYADCTAATPSTTDPRSTTIDAMNSGSAAILSGTTNVIFDTVTFTNGHALAGGGIHFTGLGSLTLLNVAITSNLATNGGGLEVEATGPTTVVVSTGTLISENHAENDGGGVRLSGKVHLLFVGPQAAIANNTADDDEDGLGDGGGLLITGPAYADIASPGYDFPGGVSWGAISGNTAIRGAGVLVRNGGTLRLIETVYSQGRPTRIEDNGDARTLEGGGIFAGQSGTHVCGWGFRIANNLAQHGPALVGDGATVSFASDVISSPCGSAPVSASGAVDCRAGVACNAIVGNTSIVGDAPVVSANTLQADRLEFRDNATHDDGIYASLITASNSLFANNTADRLVRANAFDINECTFAGNTGLAAVLLTVGNAETVSLSRSILWQPGVASVRIPAGGGNVTVFDSIAADADSFAYSGYLVSGQVTSADPRFAAPATGDYHLALASPAIDYTFTGSTQDLEGHPRGVNIRNDPDGRRNDIGAYEYTDAIFTDGFDST